MLSEKQVNAISIELRDRFIKNTIEPVEIAITLLTMERAKKITVEQVKDILLVVFFGNKKGVLKALSDASRIITDDDLDEILNSVSEKL